MSDQITHIYHNAPGVLARINQVLAAHPVNILGQYLKANERIGYVIIDVDEQYESSLIQELREVEHTSKFRVL